MPICNTTLEYRGDLAERLLKSPLLHFDEVRERGSALVKRYYTTMKFRDLAFVVYPQTGKVIVKGSWAKFHTKGKHNYTRYTTADLTADINTLSNLFDYDFSVGLIHGVEAGVNLDLSDLPQPYFSPSFLLPRIVCYQGRKPFLPMKSIRGAGQGVECVLSNYRIKVYDKALQYGLPQPLLRLEYDCNLMKELEPLGIRVFSDLTDQQKMRLLGEKVQRLTNDLIILEPILTNDLTKAERKLYTQAERPIFWQGLTRRNRSYYLTNFRALMQTYSQFDLHQTLCEQVRQEWDTLTQNCNILAGSSSNTATETSRKNCNVFSPVNWGNRNKVLDEVAGISFHEPTAGQSTVANGKQAERRCEVTGILLDEKQPLASKVVGIVTLTNDADALNQLRQRYSVKQRKRDHHSEAYRLAHGPRNEKSNPPNNLLRRIRNIEADVDLFPLSQMMKLTRSQSSLLTYFDGSSNELNSIVKLCVREGKELTIMADFEACPGRSGGGQEKPIGIYGGAGDSPSGRETTQSQKKPRYSSNTLINNVLDLFPVEPNGR